MDMTKFKVYAGPINGDIYIARIGSRGTALDKRIATPEVVSAFTMHMMHGTPNGAEMSVQVGNGYYRLSCAPITKEQFDAERASKMKS